MWLISNPLFEIGAGLVLIATTVWMLLNATAPRRAASPLQAPPLAPPPPVAQTAPTLGPLPGPASRAMYFAEEKEAASPEPPLRLAPEPPAPPPPAPPPPAPPLAMRLPDMADPVEASAPVVAPRVEAAIVEPDLPAQAPVIPPEPLAIIEAAAVASSLPPPEPEPEPERIQPAPPVVAEGAEATPSAGALPSPPPAAEPPLPAPPPAPLEPFEARYASWLDALLQSAPGAASPAMVAIGAARMRRFVDPAWPAQAGDLRAAIESLGKLAPAAFSAPGARDSTAALVESVGAPLVLIWPRVGEAFDSARQEARSGEGEAVASVQRPGLAYGEAGSALPALVVRGPAPPSTPSA